MLRVNLKRARRPLSQKTGSCNVPTMNESGPTPGDLLRALRQAVGLTQDQVAERTSGKLSRVYVVRLETGHNQAKTDHVRSALASVYGLTRDQIADYLDGALSLEGVLAVRRANERGRGKPEPAPLLRTHPRWRALVEEARKMRSLPLEAFELIADSPFVWGPLDALDATLLADLARDVWDWSRRERRSS